MRYPGSLITLFKIFPRVKRLTWVPAALLTAALLLSPGAGSAPEARPLKAAPRLSQAGPGNATVLWTDLFSPLGGKENFAQAAAALGSRVFVVGGGQTLDDKYYGAVVAYDAKTGGVQWYDNPDLGGDSYNFLSSVAASGSTVYVAGSAVIEGQECLYVKAYDASGLEKWLCLEDIPGLRGLSCTVVAQGRNVVACANNGDSGFLYGLNPKTGAVKWRVPFPPGKWVNCLVLSGSALYASGRNSAMDPPGWVIQSYSAQTGAFRWETPLDNLVYLENIAAAGAIVAAAGYAYGVGGHNEGVLRTFAAKSGLPGWTANFAPDGTGAYYQVIIKGSRIFAGAHGLLGGRSAAFARAYNAKNGALLWSQPYDIGPPDGCAPRALTATKQGVYLAGNGKDESGAEAWFVMAVNPLSGAVMWDDQFTMGSGCVPGAIAGTSSSIIAAGEGTDPSLNPQWVVRAYAPK